MEAALLSQSRFKSQVWKIWFQFDIKEPFFLSVEKQHCKRSKHTFQLRTLNCNCVLLLMRFKKNHCEKDIIPAVLTSEGEKKPIRNLKYIPKQAINANIVAKRQWLQFFKSFGIF